MRPRTKSIVILNNSVGGKVLDLVSLGDQKPIIYDLATDTYIHGDPAMDGAQGAQGYQGETGAQGVQGATGSQGAQGADGYQGVDGDDGAQGAQGATGAQGVQGADGAQGAQGDIGAQGLAGAQGVQGSTGTQGADGTQGYQGYQGVTGSEGSQGVQGSQGTQGYQGVQGDSGASIAIDDTAPTGSEQVWYQPTKGILNIKVDAQWVESTRSGMDGSQGVQGTQGYQGTQGVQGVQGADGTMPDGSVTYAKFASALTQRATDNDGAWDFSANGIVDAAISTNTTVTLSNLQLNKSLKIKIVVTNSATITFPSYCKKLDGFTDPSGTDGTYYLYMDCWNATVSSEEVLMNCIQVAT